MMLPKIMPVNFSEEKDLHIVYDTCEMFEEMYNNKEQIIGTVFFVIMSSEPPAP